MEKILHLDVTAGIQGENSATCYAQVLVNKLLATNPAEVKRLINDLKERGHAKLNDLELRLPSCGLDRIRDFARQQGINQDIATLTLSIAEAVNGEYTLQIDPKTGEVYSVNGSERLKGGKADWVEEGAKKAFGKNLVLNAYNPAAKQEWSNAFSCGRLNKCFLSIYADGTGRHILLIDRVENGRVYFIDSFKADIGYYRDLFGEAARKEGFNSWSVDLETLLNSGRIAYSICDSNVFTVNYQLADNSLENFVPFIIFSSLERAREYLSRENTHKRHNGRKLTLFDVK